MLIVPASLLTKLKGWKLCVDNNCWRKTSLFLMIRQDTKIFYETQFLLARTLFIFFHLALKCLMLSLSLTINTHRKAAVEFLILFKEHQGLRFCFVTPFISLVPWISPMKVVKSDKLRPQGPLRQVNQLNNIANAQGEVPLALHCRLGCVHNVIREIWVELPQLD